MLDQIIQRCARVNRVLATDITSQSEKTFVLDAKAMAVGVMIEVGIAPDVIREQLGVGKSYLHQLEHMHKSQYKRGGYYYQDFVGVLSYITQPVLEEGDYSSAKELSQQDIIIKLREEIQTLKTKLQEKCK